MDGQPAHARPGRGECDWDEEQRFAYAVQQFPGLQLIP
jgi:hypothetical protein